MSLWHLYFTDKTKRSTSQQAGASFWIPGEIISMLGVGRAAPAQFSAAVGGGEFTAHSRRRPEGRFYLFTFLSSLFPKTAGSIFGR